MHDILIVGGGVIGLSLAYQLAPRQSVLVVERGRTGNEASWAGAGILPPAKDFPGASPLTRLAALSARLHPQWAAALQEETGLETGFRVCGGVYLARDAATKAELHATVAEWRQQQVRADEADPATLATLEPALANLVRREPEIAAWIVPEESQVRNPWHLRTLRAACERRGVTFAEESPVAEVTAQGDQITAVRTQSEQFAAGQFCFAAGAWTGLVLKELGLQLPVRPIRGQIVLYRTEQRLLNRIINVGKRYLVPRGDGRVLVGSTEEEAGFLAQTTTAGIEGLKSFAADLAPELAAAPVEKTWAGLRPGTGDGQPLIGRLSPFRNAWVAAGHFRSGLFLSPATAVVLAAAITGDQSPVDLHSFQPVH